MTYKVAAFPFPSLHELREKYTYNITPFITEHSDDLHDNKKGAVSKHNHFYPMDDGDDPFYCFSGLVSNPAPQHSTQHVKSHGQSLELAASPERSVQVKK